jgi:Ca2+-binding EF-hand superfamily protein
VYFCVSPPCIPLTPSVFAFFRCGNCSIDAAEVTTALKHLGAYTTQQQVAELINEVDSSGNGSVEFGEFIYMVGQIRLGKNNALGNIVSSNKVSAYKFNDGELAKLKTEFASFDTSGDGRYCAYA